MSFEPRDYLRHIVLEADYLIGQTSGLSYRVDRHRVPTLELDTGMENDRRDTRAKLIDMIFFVGGGE